MKAFLTLAAITMLTASAISAEGPLQHVVHFKFKADADKAQVQKVVDGFAALAGKIPAIAALQYGTNVSKEGRDKGYTHCWIVSFKNAADLDIYLVHPDHVAFVNTLKPVLEDALVVDFVAQTAGKKVTGS